MVTLADSLVSSASRRLPLRMRPDLSMRHHRYHGKPYWVVKEPIGLKYFRFQEEEFSILQMLDGECSFTDIKEQFERDFAPQKISLNDLQHFIGMLHRSGLLITDAEGQGRQLKRRRDEQKWKEFVSKLSNILAIRFKGIDPDRILTWLLPFTGWFFSKWAVTFFLSFGLSALMLVAVQFDVFRNRLPAFHEFFGPENWIYLGVTLGITKILHEFGHGLTCKRYGGECHEMGVMILVLTPCLYCNVSDSWLLPNKWHRAAIGAGGMYVEIVLASIATYLWWFSEQGVLLNQICLSVMFICSVSTILFNGNPLLRFDGYYILADIAEIPNLRQKSSKILQRIMSQWCLGIEQQDDPFLPQRHRWFFALYTTAAVVYRWVVVLSILMFLNKVLEPYNLQIVGQLIACASLFGLVVQPIWQLGKFLHVPGRMHQVKKKNLYITIAVLVVLIAAFCYVPLPYSVKCAVQLEPKEATTVYASVPGRLTKVAVHPGEQVKEEDLLAVMENLDLEMSVSMLEQAVEKYNKQLEILNRQKYSDYANAADIEGQMVVTAKLRDAKLEQLVKEREDLAKLEIRAHAPGTILPAQEKKKDPEVDGLLPSWSGSLFDRQNLGAQLQPTDQFCRIGDPTQFEAVLAADQTDIDDIYAGQKVRIKLDAYANRIFETTIEKESDISRDIIKVTPATLSQQEGGSVASRTAKAGMQVPLSATYQVRVPMPNDEGLYQIDLRGRAKIAARWKSLGSRVWRYLTKTFHFEL